MPLTPRGLITFLTFPGVILHEWSHKKFCDWFGVRVYKVVYFRFGNPLGFVFHEEPATYKQIFWISIGPLIINSLAAFSLSFFASHFEQVSRGRIFLLVWLALSFGMHAFPSDKDMEHISSRSKAVLLHGGSWFHIFSFPIVFLVWIANKLKYFWFDVFYAITLVVFGIVLK